MWKYISDGSFVTGVLPQDMTDEEFAEAAKVFDAREGKKGLLEATGLWKHEADTRPAKED
jgi:hypothetical protein